MRFARTKKILSFILTAFMVLSIIQPVSTSYSVAYKTENISGIVWEDTNGNGIKDSKEPGVEGIRVYSYWGNGNNMYGSTVSTSDGSYNIPVKNTGNDVVIKIDLDEIGSKGYTITTDKEKESYYGSKINVEKYHKDAQSIRRTDKFKPSYDTYIGIGLAEKNQEETDQTELDMLDVSRSLDKKSINQGESLHATYTITPKPLKKLQMDNDSSKKSVVLVIDTSGSMRDSNKMGTMKSVAKSFVEELKASDNVSVGVVEYSSHARKVADIKPVSSNLESIKSRIGSLGIGGATNIGDGIRAAKTMLDSDLQAQEKYIILMTDGEATAYSRDVDASKSSSQTNKVYEIDGRDKGNYWYRNDDYMGDYVAGSIYHDFLNSGSQGTGYYLNEYISYLGSQQGTDSKSLSYAKNVASQRVKNDDSIKGMFVVGFGAQAGASNSQIAAAAGGKGSYYCANSSADLQNLYAQFAQKILTSATAVIGFEESILDEEGQLALQLEAKDLPEGLEFENGVLKGNMTAQYSLNSGGTEYEAQPIEFKVEYKFGQAGKYKFGGSNSSSAKLNVFDETQTEMIAEETVTVNGDVQTAPAIDLDVNDAEGAAYKSRNDDGTENPALFDKGLMLKGNSVATLKITDKTISDARYKIIRSDAVPSMPSDSEMTKIDGSSIVHQSVYPDLVKDKPGYLTARNYDVSHLKTMSDQSQWNDKGNVFKNPTSSIEYRSTASAGTVEGYINRINGVFRNYTVFMNEMNIGSTGGPYPDYKEASKFWGYITPAQTGDYWFGTRSDDGSCGYIIVGGEKLKIAEQFTIHGSQFKTSNVKMHLEKGEYYPIYLEYSNWGGRAEHRLIYKESAFSSSTSDSGGDTVPADWFRPTTNTEPGEVAEQTFESTAIEGIPFPDETGIYYMAAKAKNGNNVTSERIYGPFVVGLKSSFEIARGIQGEVRKGEFFDLKYTVNPKDIEIGDFGEKLTVKEFSIEETFPSGITVGAAGSQFNVDGSTIISNPVDIEYKREGNVYRADPFEITVTIKADSQSQSITIGENDSAFAIYSDFDGSAQKLPIQSMTIGIGQLAKPEEFNVLELQPGNSFELTQQMFEGMGSSVNVDHMPLRQFIGSIEDINGKYDVVYIGNLSSGDPYSSRGAKASSLPQGGSGSVEYYSENDITEKKIGEIREYIESGQPLVVDGSVFTSADQNTRLYKNLVQHESKANLIKASDDIAGKIISSYSACAKRPVLKIDERPSDYNGIATYEDDSIMKFKYGIRSQQGEGLMTARLYFDKNADGFFRDDEMVAKSVPRPDGEGYSMECRIDDSFTGMMPWKLEITDESGTKAYKVGYPAYRGKKLKTRVLHLTPSGNQLSIKNGSGFTPSLNTDEYEIMVTELPVKMFSDGYPNDVEYGGKTVKTQLNGNYDMIVMGFADTYGGGDITSEQAIDAVKDFIRTGQSVMFTHDVFTFRTESSSGWGLNLAKQFRDIAGQSRYADPNNPSGLDVWGKAIAHDQSPEQGKKTYGFSNEALDRAKSGSFNTYTSTYMINEGVLTKYPYILPQELKVATTHYQYYQLNLEDEDVVAWFSLNGATQKYDPRNYYYTYSKGNVTYSGTGHSKPSGIPEQEFFVNTMVKAARDSNHAPTITTVNLDQNGIISTNQELFEFSFIADDIDGDALSGNIYINGTPVRTYSVGEIKLNQPVNVKITNEELKSILGGIEDSKSFILTIEVVDTKGAKAQENSNFTVRYFANPVFTVQAQGLKDGYLVGDKGSVDIVVSAQKTDEKLDNGATNLNLEMDCNGNGVEFLETGGIAFEDVAFNPEPEPKTQKRALEFTAKAAGSYSVENTLSYSCPDFVGLGEQKSVYSYPISVRKGTIDVKAAKTNGMPVDGLKISVRRPDGSTTEYELKNGSVTLDSLTSGKYEISVTGLGSDYAVKGATTREIELSYRENRQSEEFEIIDKNDTALELEASGVKGCLLGDTRDVSVKAFAQSEDDGLNTTIKDIEYSMDISDGLELIGSGAWKLEDVKIENGKPVSNAEQSTTFKVKAVSEGKNSVTGTLVYGYDGIKDTRSSSLEMDVRRGMISVTAASVSGTPFKGIDVTVSGEGYQKTIKTDETGKCVFYDMPSGTYTIAVDLPSGVTASGGNSKTVEMSYESSERDVQFVIGDKIESVAHGKFANGKVSEGGTIMVPKGSSAELGIEVEFYGSPKDQSILLTLDPKVTSSVFTLYEVSKDKSLVQLEEDSSYPDNNMKIYRVTDGSVEGPLTQQQINDILSSSDEPVQLKIVIPDRDGKLDNHFIIKYEVEHRMNPGEVIENNVSVNGAPPKSCILKLAGGLSYT